MLITKEIDVVVQGTNIKYYKNLGYDVSVGDKITIPISQLFKSSKIKVEIKCDICGVEKESFYFAYNKYIEKSPDNKYRCGKCNIKIRNKTCLEKYGVENVIQSKEIQEKRKESFQVKYGVDHYNQLDEFKEKIKDTNKEKYGVEYPMQNETIKEKQLKTTFDKFGVKCSLHNKVVNDKTLKTMIEKYGNMYSTQNKEIIKKIIDNGLITRKRKILEKYKDIIEISGTTYLCKCDVCGETYTIYSHLYYQRINYKTIKCTNCNPIDAQISGKELSLLQLIKENYDGEIILNSRKIIKPFELDIYLPELKIAFEFNGTYWHSNKYKETTYHSTKTEKCLKKKIDLIHIFEDDWDNNYDTVKEIILSKINNYEYLNEDFVFEINGFIFEDRRFNLLKSRNLNLLNKIENNEMFIGNNTLHYPGFNIYNKQQLDILDLTI